MKQKTKLMQNLIKQYRRPLQVIKLFALVSFFAINVIAGNIYSQHVELSLNIRNTTIREAFSQIEKSSDYVFLVRDEAQSFLDKRVSLSTQKSNINQILDVLLSNSGLDCRVVERQVLIYRKVDNSILSDVEEIQQKSTPTITVSGIIKDRDNEPLPGVSIIVKGTNQGIASDFDGRFVLPNIPENAIINISYVGMKGQSISINKRTYIEVILSEDEAALEELVVTGYQTLSRERATGLFETVGEKYLNKPSTSVEQSIIGNVSGIQIINKGYRDRDESIIIRGLTSLGANSKPLIIVDGFPIEGELSSINPNDIANITVLKDAAAASIWGARSANGVIVISTKAAKKGKVNVELNSFMKFTKKLDLDYANPLATSAETLEYEKMGFDSNFFKRGSLMANNYSNAIYHTSSRLYSQGVIAMNENKLGFLDDNLDKVLSKMSMLDNRNQIKNYLLNSPTTQQYNLAISGGTESLRNVASVMFDKNDAPFKGNDDQRFTLNYRTDISLFKWLDISLNTMFQYNKENLNGVSLAEIQGMSPYDMLIGENGEYLHIQKDVYLPIITRYISDKGVIFPYDDWTYNPLRESKGRDFTRKQSYARVQGGLKFNIIEGLYFDTKFQYELMNGSNKNLYSEDTYQIRFNVNYNSEWNGDSATLPKQNVAKGMGISESNTSLDAWSVRNQLTYNRSFDGFHDIAAIVGTEVNKRVYQSTSYPLMYGFDDNLLSITPPLNGIYTPSNPIYNMFGQLPSYFTGFNYPSATRTYMVDKYFSFYSNVSYTFYSKYTISGSFRTDASNLISSNPSIRYSPFWSTGLAWQLGQEDFMKTIEWINRLNYIS